MVHKKKRLKLAILIRDFVKTGGAEKYTVEITQRLAREHEVHVFAQSWNFDGKERIVFHRIPRFFIKPNILNQLLFSYFVRRAVDDTFDIIHSHERVTQFDVLTVHCPCFRAIITRHRGPVRRMTAWASAMLSPRKIAYLWLERRQFAFHKKRMIIAVSEYIKRDIQNNYPLPNECFGIAYPGVDNRFIHKETNSRKKRELRSELGIGEDDLVVLFVGTEFKRKGLDALLEGFSLAHRPNLRLVIAGGGEKKRYVSLARRLGVEKDVIFLGLVENIGDIYSISNIYILPTLIDPAGMAPLEAMASGVPTIMSCSEYAGIAEQIHSGEALILTNPKDPTEIARSLLDLMNDTYRRELGNRGRRLASNLTWEKTTADTVSVYRRVMELKECGGINIETNH